MGALFSDPHGERIGRYVLLGRLGDGGMGEVFRACDPSGREVALKRLRAVSPCANQQASTSPPLRRPSSSRETEPATSEEDGMVRAGVVPESPHARRAESAPRMALAREFRVLGSLRHPNVVEVLDYGFDRDGHPFFTMQILEGARSIVSASRELPLGARVQLFAQLLRALRYIHRRGIVHRDLSPRNVLVEPNGTVKVLDFGLSFSTRSAASGDRDDPLARWGTRGYAAPELALGISPSPRSDLFAVGRIGAEMFARTGAGELDVDERVRPILEDLFRADWRERASDAGVVIERLARATGIVLEIDTAVIRERAITMGPLVGRDSELAQLDSAVAAAQRGQGSAWLLEGESGIGKSRLLEEARTRAMVDGCLVLEGRSVSDGGGPYEPFIHVVRDLTYAITPTPAEREDLATVDRPRAVSDNAAEAAIAQNRLFAAIRALLARADRPIVILLEDVHWATDAAVALMEELAKIGTDSPVVVIATARSRATDLRFRGFQRLALPRLPPSATTTLVRHALEQCAEEDVVRIASESEGHPLFLVELLRSVAEPPELDGEGAQPRRIHGLMRARLARLSAEEQSLIEIAAVLGREVDRKLLGEVSGNTADLDLDTWTTTCAAADILEVRDDRPRFVHDQLREAILTATPEEKRRRWHRLAGEVILRRAADERAVSASLAHHFEHAGDDPRTSRFAGMAGEEAIASGANTEALRLFALALRTSNDDRERLQRARWCRLSAVARLKLGDHREAYVDARRALRELGGDIPPRPQRFVVEIGRDLVDVAVQRMTRPRIASARSSAMVANDHAAEQVLVYLQLGEASLYLDDPLGLAWSATRAMTLVDSGSRESQILAYSGAGLIAGIVGAGPVARAWLDQAIVIAEREPSSPLLATAVHRRGAVSVIRADWSAAHADLSRARTIASQARDERQWREATTVLGLWSMHHAQSERAEELFLSVVASARRDGDLQAVLWGAPTAALCRLQRGDLAAADRMLEEAADAVQGASTHDRVNYHGVRALAAFRRDDRVEARASSLQTLALLGQSRLVAYWAFHGLDCALDTLFALAETEENEVERGRLVNAIAEGCRFARRLGRFCRFMRPHLTRYEARQRVLLGPRTWNQRLGKTAGEERHAD